MDGVAVGSLLGPTLAIAFMCSMEQQWLADCPLEIGPLIFHRRYQNIFPLANTFAKRENVRPGQSPTGTQMVSFRGLLCGACARH